MALVLSDNWDRWLAGEGSGKYKIGAEYTHTFNMD